MGKKLNLGCGEDYREGWINVDSRENVLCDVKFDLEKFPWQLRTNEFDEVYASHVLEHLNNPVGALKEISRITKKNARIIIKVPHATSYANLTDLQHKTNFTENSFSENHMKQYELEHLELIRKEFLFPKNKWKRYIPLKQYLKIFLNGIYDDLLFEFKVIK